VHFCSACGTALTAGSAALAPPRRPDLATQFSALQQALPASVQEQIVTQPEGENRVLTILFADLTGSVRTMAHLSPEDAAALVNDVLKAMVDAILAHGGRINRILGDAVLAFFGTPQAHENDPERAILAALAVREAVQKLGLDVTAGINTGDVYLGAVGSDQHHEFSAIGTAINLAARLREKAQPGQILVGEAVHRQTRRAFAFTRHSLDVKGLAGPIAAYEVLRPLPHPEKVRGIEGLRSVLIGREQDLAALIDCADALLAARQGQIVTIIGEAGIGKTRLIAELKGYLQEKDILWLEGRCLEIGQPVSFWPVIDLLRTYLGVAGDDPDEQVGGRLIQLLDDLFGPDADGIIPYVGHMLSIALEDRYQERLRYAAPEQIRRQTLLRLRDLFVALARRRPLVLILEDLHWADEPSLEMLWVLLDELTSAPVLLVCAYRPEHEHACGRLEAAAAAKLPERHTGIHLKPLTARQSQRMVDSLLALPDLPAATREAIQTTTEGNPFFVEEVVRLLIERGAIYREAGRWRAGEASSAVPVPDTIESVILSRIDRLQGDVKYLLQCAAVIGRVFQRRLLQYVSGRQEALDEHLARLEEHGLVYRERIVPEEEYAFKHALTQMTTYEALLVRHRQAFHERIGAGIEALYEAQLEEYYEVLAYHYSRSANSAKAIDYLIKAGDKATGRYATGQALTYFGQALELATDTETQESILTRRAALLADIYQGQAAAEDYGRLLASARERGAERVELEALLGLCHAWYVAALDATEGDYPARYRQAGEDAYALARKLGDKRGMIRALVRTGWFMDFSPDYTAIMAANLREAMALSSEIGWAGDEDPMLDSRYGAWRVLTREEFDAWSEQMIRQCTARHDLRRLKEVYFALMWGNLAWGKLEQSVACCDEGVRLAAELGVPPVMYPTIKALALVYLGRYGDAWQSLQQEVTDQDHAFGRAFQEFGVAIYLHELMAYGQAATAFRKVEEQGRRLGRSWLSYAARCWLAVSLVRDGQHDAAELAGFAPEQAPAPDRHPTDDRFYPLSVLPEILLAQGQAEEALRQARSRAAQADEEGFTPSTLAHQEVQLRILSRLSRWEEAVTRSSGVLGLAQEMSALPMVWRVQAARAEALAALGEAEEAARAFAAAAAVIRTLAGTIPDSALKEGFLTGPRVAAILAAAPAEGAAYLPTNEG
jgi:class 3 adenylate cyclase/tetratricopeptide (TPR) repeat protein